MPDRKNVLGQRVELHLRHLEKRGQGDENDEGAGGHNNVYDVWEGEALCRRVGVERGYCILYIGIVVL